MARFLRRLGLSVNRLDWWNIAAELTPFEINVLRIQEELEPTGEERADMRAAVNTACQASTMATISEAGMNDLMRSLTTYTAIDRHESETRVASPAQAAAIFGSIR